MRLLSLTLFLFLSFTGCGQPDSLYQPATDTLLIAVGDSTVPVHKSQYGNAPVPFFVHLHHNEQTADTAAQYYLQRHGGVLLSIKNNRQRLLTFSSDGVTYLVDPNRIFTAGGADRSLRILNRNTGGLLQQVVSLGDTLLSLIPDSVAVIAVHNNTDGAYSLRSYLPGGVLEKEATDVYHNSGMDEDDFVLTTDPGLFAALQQEGINAILQNSHTADDDGSLGYVFGRAGRIYANVEAEHGHLEVQLRIINVVARMLMPAASLRY